MNLLRINPAAVTNAVAQALSSQGESPDRLQLDYLRRKPGRGLVAVYRSTGDAQRRVYTASVDEAGMGLPHPGLTLQRFPADRQLPGLADAMAPAQHAGVRAALEAAAASLLPAGGRWSLAAAAADPLRYKPGDRCVVRYHATFQRSGPQPARMSLSVIGKLYREGSEAKAAQRTLQRLSAMPWSAAPLAVANPLPLLLTEDLGSAADDPPVLAGSDAIRHIAGHLPLSELRAAATALADLHTSGVATSDTPVRTAADEAAKADKRAAVLSAYVTDLGPDIQRISGRVATRLRELTSDVSWPAHGSYKPSQLLYRESSVHLVDFDQFCWADPALDVGYFLAYLRPSGLWYRRAGTRAWFETAAAAFLAAYDRRLRKRGIAPATRSGIYARCHSYEAALLLKIAARRVNRLQSPRPGEIAAVLREIDQCLTATKG